MYRSFLLFLATGVTVALLSPRGNLAHAIGDHKESKSEESNASLRELTNLLPFLHSAQEIVNNQFVIDGYKSGMKVSWQVTCIRIDALLKPTMLMLKSTNPAMNSENIYIFKLLT